MKRRAHAEEDHQAADDPRGIPGKWVLLGILLVSLLGSTAAVMLVRPAPGSRPAEIHDRPFGPATPAEQHDAPLIYRRASDE